MKLSKLIAVFVIALALAGHSPAAAQTPAGPVASDSLDAAKGLYAAASYEAALEMLTRLKPASEHAAYEVFCLIALDRVPAAEKRIQEILELDPLFAPDREEASPRVLEMFDKVRTFIAPRLARGLYVDGKAAFDRKESEVALKKFELLLQIIERAGAADSVLADLKLLASGYLDLAKAAVAPPPAPAAAAPAASAPVPQPEEPVTPPVPISETFPPWEPSRFGVTRGQAFQGVIRVTVSDTGRVLTATIVESIHPSYDQPLLDAAAKWRYKPGRRGAVPVESERLVAVRLKPE
jgi:tetratricopeptide (TPR) repeat protein